MKKRLIKITEEQFKRLNEDSQITITDKLSPEGFAAAKAKSKSTGSQINVALGTTTNSDGRNGVETKLDPNATTSEFNKGVNDAKQTGLETTFVAPIENFSDYNQLQTTSDRVSDMSGIDEKKCFTKAQIIEAKRQYLSNSGKTYAKKDLYNGRTETEMRRTDRT